MSSQTQSRDLNRDPITGEPGSHPVGTGVGAAAGGATGAAIGSVAGPVGTLIGAAVGAVAGGMTGHGVAEAFDPTAEDAYWRDNHGNEGYADTNYTYDDYQPAYRLGYESAAKGGSYDEPGLRDDWERVKGKSGLGWEKAKHATKAGWHRVERAFGDKTPENDNDD